MPWFIWSRRDDPSSRLRKVILAVERGEGLHTVGWWDRWLAAGLHGLRGLREIVLCWQRRSRGCAKGFGIPRWRQLAALFLTTFRYNFPPSLYYRARLFRLKRERWLAVFSHDEAVTLAPVMEHRTADLDIWSKSGWQLFCEQHALPGVSAVARVRHGKLTVFQQDALQGGMDLFLKPDEGWGCRGTVLLEWQADRRGWRACGATTEFVPCERLPAFLVTVASDHAIEVQLRLKNHADFADLAQRALINFRVMTLRHGDGTIEVFTASLRIPGYDEHCSDVPNGYFVPIHLAAGTLGGAETLDMGAGVRTTHPVTQAPISGRKIAQWSEMCALAIRAHGHLPESVPCVGWDLVATNVGLRLLEANIAWSGNLAQQRGLAPLGESRWPEVMLAYVEQVSLPELLAEAESGRRLAAQSERAHLG